MSAIMSRRLDPLFGPTSGELTDSRLSRSKAKPGTPRPGTFSETKLRHSFDSHVLAGALQLRS